MSRALNADTLNYSFGNVYSFLAALILLAMSVYWASGCHS